MIDLLPGQLDFILFLATALTLPISMGILKLYHRAVLRLMKARASLGSTESMPPEFPTPSHKPMQPTLDFTILDHTTGITTELATESLYLKLVRAPWRAAAIYMVAGLCYAFVMASATLAAFHLTGFLPFRLITLLWGYAWPVVLTVNIMAAVTWRIRLVISFAYFIIFVILGAIVAIRSPAFNIGQLLLLWLITNLIPTVLMFAFLNRKVRTVGPLVLIFMILAVIGPTFLVTLVGSDHALLHSVAKAGIALGLNAQDTLIGLDALGIIASGLIAWLILIKWIKSRYEQKKISDQSITLDALWLMFGVAQSIPLAAGANILWILSGFLAFMLYKAVTWTGFLLLGRKADRTRKNPNLLLLRVFSLGKRSEMLFDILTTYWRYLGSVQLIAGPDLATTTVEPDEFLDFIRGKLVRRFINNSQTLESLISNLDLKPDRDRRFRVNDFFCYEDTWRMALSRLVNQSDAVLMDLRGFSPQNAGCVFEINELINLIQLGRVVFVIDKTTDEQFLRQIMEQSWNGMRPTSPNRASQSGQLRLFRLQGLHHNQLQLLLRALCASASSRSEIATNHPT
jgi:hypothetical protein